MFIRNESFQQFIRYYPVVTVIVGINTLFILLYLLLPSLYLNVVYQFGVGNNYAVSLGEYWRLVTPIFLHGGIGHFVFNSFALIIFGPALERMLGIGKFITAYLFAGIVGNLGTFFFADHNLFDTHLGASGAIYGLFGLYVYMILMRKELIDSSSRQIILVILAVGIAYTFIMPNINKWAHLFGFIGGAILGPLFLSGKVNSYHPPLRRTRHFASHIDDEGIQFDPNRWQKKRQRQKIIKIAVIIVVAILALIGIYNNFF